MNDIAVKTALEYVNLKNSLNEFLKLKEKAFRFLGSSIQSSGSTNPVIVFTDHWLPLFDWHGLYLPQDDSEVEQLFYLLANRAINKEEFKNRIAPSVNAIEEYAKKLDVETTNKLCEFEKLYDNFKGFSSEYEFSFTMKLFVTISLNSYFLSWIRILYTGSPLFKYGELVSFLFIYIFWLCGNVDSSCYNGAHVFN